MCVIIKIWIADPCPEICVNRVRPDVRGDRLPGSESKLEDLYDPMNVESISFRHIKVLDQI